MIRLVQVCGARKTIVSQIRVHPRMGYMQRIMFYDVDRNRKIEPGRSLG